MTTSTQNDAPVESTRSRGLVTTVDKTLGYYESRASRYGIPALRIAIGIVYLVFGALKFIPGASPIEDLVIDTWSVLTFGLVSGQAAVIITAVLEVLIGLIFITGLLMPLGMLLLAVTVIGFVAPLVLFTGELFPGGFPTLTAQYIIKDLVLVVGALVVAGAVAGKLRRRLADRERAETR